MGVEVRRPRRSALEWSELIERFRSSDESESSFCRRENVSRTSFSNWKRRIGRTSSKQGSFVELAAPSVSSSLASGEFEIILPGNVVLRWKV